MMRVLRRMRHARRRTVLIVAGAVAATALAVAVIVALLPGGSKPGPAARLYSPFTGEPVRTLGPVLAVKIDNVAQAHPQTGLTAADIVYVVPVEGGLTRLLAVFSSHTPPVIGPVRSAREADLELLRQFGRPAFAYSGATPHLLPFIGRARIVDLYAGRVGGYFRDSRRAAPHNLYARGGQLLAEAKEASDARDIGFRFGAAPPGGHPEVSLTVSYPAASVTFRWSDRRGTRAAPANTRARSRPGRARGAAQRGRPSRGSSRAGRPVRGIRRRAGALLVPRPAVPPAESGC